MLSIDKVSLQNESLSRALLEKEEENFSSKNFLHHSGNLPYLKPLTLTHIAQNHFKYKAIQDLNTVRNRGGLGLNMVLPDSKVLLDIKK